MCETVDQTHKLNVLILKLSFFGLLGKVLVLIQTFGLKVTHIISFR